MFGNKELVGAAVVGALMLAGGVDAAYTGLSVSLHNTVTIDGNSYSVFRVYANFTDPGDRLVYGGSANPQTDPCVIESRNSDDSAPGGPFWNRSLPSHTAPNQARG